MTGMQNDMFGDGELPVPLSETAYYAEMLHNAEELPEALCLPLALELKEGAHEHTVKFKLYRGAIEVGTKWTKISIYSYIGDHQCTVCFGSDDYKSQCIVIQGLAAKFKEVLFV